MHMKYELHFVLKNKEAEMRNASSPFNDQLQRALQELRSFSAKFDYGLYGRLFRHFGDFHLPLQAIQLHARLVLFKVIPDNFLASRLIAVYGKINRIRDARHVFDQIPNRNTFSYNAMLIAYSLNDCSADALRLFSSLACMDSMDARPDHYSITSLLKSLSNSVSDYGNLVKEVHGFVLRNGLDADVFVENALISSYSKCSEAGLARKMFDRMTKRDLVSWNSMIAGYSQGGFYRECKDLFSQMMDSSGFRPDGVTLLSVLQACAQSKDQLFGIEVHRYVVDNEIELDINLCNALIGLYAKSGSLDYARELFEDMSEKDDVSYSALVSGYMLHGFVDKSVELFGKMKRPGLNVWNSVISGLVQNNWHEQALEMVRQMQAFGCRPAAVTLASILPSLSKFSNLRGGKEIHAYAVKNGFDRNIYIATAIIHTYGKAGFISGAQRVFDQSKSRSVVLWTAIISAYAAHGDASSALSLFDEMLLSGIEPDPVSFTAVLSVCDHCGMVDKAWEIFSSMSAKYAIQPSIEHYACIVGVLSRAGRLSEATEFVSKMPVEPTAKVWGPLLSGASVAGDVEIGKFVCDNLFKIEPENTGNYVIMANLYSQAGRWKEADEVRKRMDEIGLKKIPGNSWTESSQEFQTSISGDTSCEKAEGICM